MITLSRSLAVCALLLATVSCGVKPLSPEDARTQIAAIYARQDAGFAKKNIDEMFYRVPADARYYQDGTSMSGAKARTAYGGLFYHGSNLQTTTKITKLTLSGDQAIVETATTTSYDAINSNENSIMGKSERFEEHGTTRDAWRHDSSGWWLRRSEVLTYQELREGAPYTASG